LSMSRVKVSFEKKKHGNPWKRGGKTASGDFPGGKRRKGEKVGSELRTMRGNRFRGAQVSRGGGINAAVDSIRSREGLMLKKKKKRWWNTIKEIGSFGRKRF